MASSPLRLRRNNNKKSKTKKKELPASSHRNNGYTRQKTPDVDQEETLWETFVTHPIVRITFFVLLPYTIYHSYYYLVLQHPPEFLVATGILRPAVASTDPRQVLIVGTDPDLQDTAAALWETLRLEVAVDTSDTMQYFARDGTVGAMHGIRFLSTPPPASFAEPFGCRPRRKTNRTIGFLDHRNFHHATQCAKDDTVCQMQECQAVLRHEWGCGWDVGGERDEYHHEGCSTPYERTLLQARHPLRALEALVSEFCTPKKGHQEAPLRLLVQHMPLPSLPNNTTPSSTTVEDTDTCWEVLAKYIAAYYTAMLDALDQGSITGMYRIEEVSVCNVAKLAGLDEAATTVYEPNHARFQKVCGPETTSTHKETKIRSKGVSTPAAFTWEDTWGGVHGSKRAKNDREIEQLLRYVTKRLGYND